MGTATKQESLAQSNLDARDQGSAAQSGPADRKTDGKGSPANAAEAKKHFETFETHFFQQGDESNFGAGQDIFHDGTEDMAGRKRHLLSYRSMVGLTVLSSTVAVAACIALLRNNAPAPLVGAAPSAQPAYPSPTAAPALAAAPSPAAAPVPGSPSALAAAPSASHAPSPYAAKAIALAPDPAASATSVAPPASPPAAAAALHAGAGEQSAHVPGSPSPKAASPTVEARPSAAAQRIAQAEPEKKAEPEKRAAPEKKAELLADAKPKTAVASSPAQESSTRERCRAAVRDKRTKEITATCTAAFAEDATDAEAAVAVARVEFDRGRFAQAYTWSKKAIAINPDVADAYAFAGAAEQNQGHGKAAKEAYLRYLQLAPSGRYATDIRSIVGSL
ncbi:MAG: hypothetical protein ABSB49_16880 [Polyangia bacterium]